MRLRRRGIRSAYGQLVLLVFLPIAILASVGAVLVFFEVTRAVQSEQDVLAQAALIRYEPLVRPLLPSLESGNDVDLRAKINEMGANGMTDALLPAQMPTGIGKRYISGQLYRIYSEQHVKRIAILDAKGAVLVSVGVDKDADWGHFDATSNSVWRQATSVGTAYGMPMYATINGTQKRFWLFVDMDNEPLVISYYRILLALAITGLTTMLLLLLILNLYAKRWIAPIYEMRLHLQRVHADNLGKLLEVRSDGEFYLLQKELNATFRRLKMSFAELKAHSIETEKYLQQAFDEMEMQNISIRKARDLAISSGEAKSAFLANISHELRTPLNAIDGFINLLARDGRLDSKQMLYVQTIKKSSAHLLALISDVLDFSKMEAGKLALDNHIFDLYATIYEVADMLSPMAMDKSLRMSVLFYHDVPVEMVGDRLRVKQILTNLLGNAVKFTDTGGISIKVILDEDNIKIMVSDTGRGIDKQTQGSLFQSFSQGDLSVTRRYGGTGLGLVICKQLVALMGGQIGFYDNNDANIDTQGATFWFSLPISQDIVEPNEPVLPPLRVLAWMSHQPNMEVLKASLIATEVRLHTAKSLAQLLDDLNSDLNYDWVIVDSFGQQGDITALLRQLRRHYQGKLAVFGYEVGLDNQLLASHGAYALHEPLDRRKLYALLANQTICKPVLSQWQGVRVLAVDDHLPNLLVLEALLFELGVEMVQADSGFAAIEIMTKAYETIGTPDEDIHRIDLIFMDISMPVMSGLAAATAIRKLQAAHAAPATPIIALSAHDRYDDKAGLLQAGMNDYAAKPIAHDKLMQLLQKWLPTLATQTPALESGALDKQPDKADKPVSSDGSINSHDVNKLYVDGILVVDWQDAIERASGKADLAQRLFLMMQNNIMDEKIALRRAWADKDVAKLCQISHRLVGATRYTGVPNLRDTAEQFYAQVATDTYTAWESERLKPYFLALMQALDRLEMLSDVQLPN